MLPLIFVLAYLQLREHLEKHQQRGAIDQEELLHQDKTLTANIESLMQMVVSLQEELEAAKREPPTEAQRLDIILADSRNFEVCNTKSFVFFMKN